MSHYLTTLIVMYIFSLKTYYYDRDVCITVDGVLLFAE